MSGKFVQNGFWDYTERWRKVFNEEKSIYWDETWMENGYCAECRFCCGPQDSDTPFPMPLLPNQLSADNEKNFYLLDRATPYLGRNGCKSDTAHGCRLQLSQKPLACGLFPIVFINGGLYLYQNCPAVIYTPLIRFLDFGKKAADLLMRYNEDELRHLCLWFTDEILARSYIDLRLKILGRDGRKLTAVECG